ncbi:MAG: PDZ domain-containing protein [Clostridia bacterium]|nr:PDZ domain-containing protein [Clostridia bacterium]
MRKSFKKIVLVFILLIIYSYVLVIQNLPDELVAFEGESITMKTLFGLNIETNSDTIEASSNNNESIAQKSGKATLKVSLFDNIPIKNVNVDVLPRTKVIPVGNIAGVKLYTSGVLVVGMSEIEGEDNKKYKPYENTGIKEGDTIIGIDESKINTTDELVETVNKSKGNNINVKYIHDDETKECSMSPVKTSNSEYKLGLWVRDSAARSWNSNFL